MILRKYKLLQEHKYCNAAEVSVLNLTVKLRGMKMKLLQKQNNVFMKVTIKLNLQEGTVRQLLILIKMSCFLLEATTTVCFGMPDGFKHPRTVQFSLCLNYVCPNFFRIFFIVL